MDRRFISANIVNVSADAIVLPANEQLKEGSGTSTAIFQAAGRKDLTAACDKHGHCDVGSAVATPAFGLDADYIIHAVVPRWEGGGHDEYGLLSSAYLSALNMADVMGCSSIAFPLLASGNNGFDKGLALKIALESIDRYSSNNIKDVIIVLYGEQTVEYVRSQGFEVDADSKMVTPQKAATRKKDTAKIDAALKMALEWAKDKDNMRMVIDLGVTIAAIVLKNKAQVENVKKAADIVKKLIK
ncbi:MAG: macro domain-containing protein [Oscillospiraceae bacterium]|nr:macro domain-containing protein [Oscillospiraceae bacterium]